ncbi:AI-2E family transporter [Roseomonas sp. M0104]|uniref:AI-2E family transporter n=1 Tax=Teichococcus coralli TaxID=2545983 RepID=A0A845B5I7_9PROT|nr:AI-2E family transporter [Pseudoroseomonas coralli]MXP62461.1 AI-2E family transporter [Pseudoroseomonas coralli]
MSRRTVSVVVLAVLLVLLFWQLPEVPLLVFAAALIGVFLYSGSSLLRRVAPVPHAVGVLVFILLLLLAAAAFAFLAAEPLAEQFNELWQQVPQALGSLTERLSRYSWGQEILRRFQPQNLSLPAGTGTSTAFTAINTTFGILGNAVLVLFLGVYFAVDPGLYRRGIELMVAPSLRPKAHNVAVEAAHTLRGWLGAQLISMTAVGLLTALGLWIIGIPLALVLGVIAGLLAFIPTIGPVMSAVPGLLVGLSEGLSGVLLVAGVYLVVQTVESYLLTPYVQRRSVDLPQAVTIIALVGFGLLYGFLGMMLATPLAAVLLMLVNRLYVDDYLERETAEEWRLPVSKS